MKGCKLSKTTKKPTNASCGNSNEGENKSGQTKRGNQFRKICSTEDPLKQNTGKMECVERCWEARTKYFGEGSAVRMWPVMFLQDETEKDVLRFIIRD